MDILRIGGIACLLTAASSAPLSAAEIRVDEARRLAVDVVWLKEGGELRGAILDSANGVPSLIAVSREWLSKANPRRLEVEEEREREQVRTRDELLLRRIDDWIARRPDDRQLLAALKPERDRCSQRLQGLAKQAEPPEFLLIEPDADSVRRGVAQPPQRRQMALAAWELRLPNVETAAAARLVPAVKEANPDWQSANPDLSERLAPLNQSDDEWAARVALWEYVFREPCDFQGTNGFVVRSDATAPRPEIASLIAPTLEGALNAQFGDLFELGGAQFQPVTDRWRTLATTTAGKAQLTACRVTRVNVDAARMSGQVQADFLVQLPDGRWESIWSDESPADIASVRPEAVDQIRNDPQVKAVAAAVQSIAGGQFDQALRFGAAVQSAQKQSDARFLAFRDRYVRRLEGPPLRWTPAGTPPAAAKAK